MATLKLVILPSLTKDNGECHIYIQVIHRRKSDRIKTDIFVLPHHFDGGRVIGGKHGDRNAQIKNFRLSELMSGYERILIDNPDKIDYLDVKGVKAFLLNGQDNYITDFFKFTELRLKEIEKNGNKGTYVPLLNMLKMVRAYHDKPTLNFSELTPRFLESFSVHYLKKGHKINSVAVYLRYIRSMFNDAIDEYNVNAASPVILNYPFRKFKIETEATQNKNLQVETVRAIRELKAESIREQISIDIFMLQVYLLGINIIDLFYMKNEAIIDGRMQYIRHKTGRFYNILLEPEAQILIEKYKGEKYLLWFADYCTEEREKVNTPHSRKSEFQYANQVAFNRMLNTQLKLIESRLELKLPSPLTTYFARHSFASLMREIGISKDDISLCLGHINVEQNLKTSSIYIKEDFKRIDVANRELIDFIASEFSDNKSWMEFKAKENKDLGN